MGRPISLFTNYSQAENRVTNYCGLMMKLIYEESPRQFNEVLAKLLPVDQSVEVGPAFEQQRNYGTSIPDLVVSQQAFTLIFETKLSDWHYPNQVGRHIQSMNQKSGKLIVFLLSNGDTNTAVRFKELAQSNPHIVLTSLTYENLLGVLRSVCKTDYLVSLISEFGQFLDETGLLPRWRGLLDIVNCGGTPHELAANAFFCPDTGGSYRHRRARWFGAYMNKEVQSVYEIDAVIVVGKGGGLDGTNVKWKNNLKQDEAKLVVKAVELVSQFRPHQLNDVALQVFLLGEKATTSFRKESPGGVRSKCYFYDDRFNTESVQQVAQVLEHDLVSWPKPAIKVEED